MNLRIGKIKTEDMSEFFVPFDWLQSKAVHLFIASNIWDTLFVEVSDDIPSDTMKYIRLRCKNIKVVLPENITAQSVNVLCELYPDKSGSIRKAYTLGRSIPDVLYS